MVVTTQALCCRAPYDLPPVKEELFTSFITKMIERIVNDL